VGYGVAAISTGRRWCTADEQMPNATTKQRILDSFQELPEDATVEDAMERLFFLSKVQRGLDEVDRGDFVSHEDIKRRFLK